MNKQELIKKIEYLGGFSSSSYIEKDEVLGLVRQLDESEIGHEDEAPRYVKNILARLRELPLHDREVWLKAIMGEFEQDFSHAKWREGYGQGKFEGMVEHEKVKVPQCVADWIERSKQEKRNLRNALNNGGEKMRLWFLDQENYDLFGRAWLDGYEVEKEKRYVVTLKNRQPLVKSQSGSILYFSQDITAGKYKATKKELEDANFGWVFDCEGVEVQEVDD